MQAAELNDNVQQGGTDNTVEMSRSSEDESSVFHEVADDENHLQRSDEQSNDSDGSGADASLDRQDKSNVDRTGTTTEAATSDVDDDELEEDDEESMLAAMLISQRNGQTSAAMEKTADVEGGVENNYGGNDLDYSSEGEEVDEDSMLASMSSLHLRWGEASSSFMNSDSKKSDVMVKDSSMESEGPREMQEGLSDEDNGRSKKAKSKRRAKQEKKQVAASNRHVASAAELEQNASQAAGVSGDTTLEREVISGGVNNNKVVNTKEVPQPKHMKLGTRGKKMKKEKVLGEFIHVQLLYCEMSILELICDFQISPLCLENTSFKTHHTLYTVVVFFIDIQILLDMVVAKHLSPLPGRSTTC